MVLHAERRGDPDVLIIGDSFANHYYAGFVANPAFAGQVVLSIGACEPSQMHEDEVYEAPGSSSPCTPRRRFEQQELIDRIVNEGPPSLVVLSGLMTTSKGEMPVFDPEYAARVLERIARFRAAGSAVVAILPHVRSTYFTRGCYSRPLIDAQYSCELTPEEIAAHSAAGGAELRREIEAAFPEVMVFDPNVIFCSDGTCGFTLDGRPIFRDQYDHFSANASEHVVGMLVDQLRERTPAY